MPSVLRLIVCWVWLALGPGVVMTTTLQTIANNQPYGSTVPYPLEFVVPVASAAGAAGATFEVRAISN